MISTQLRCFNRNQIGYIKAMAIVAGMCIALTVASTLTALI